MHISKLKCKTINSSHTALKAQESRTKLIGMKRENLVRKADCVKLSKRLKCLITNCFCVNKFNDAFSTLKSVVATNSTIDREIKLKKYLNVKII